MALAIYTHPVCLQHDTGPGHPENTKRLEVILHALKTASFTTPLIFIEAPAATEAQLLLAHTQQHINTIRQVTPASGLHYLDADTLISPNSLQAALHAAGAGCAAVEAIISGQFEKAFCAIRPPGHHATSQQAMGFCLFNNIAIAALYALKHHGLERVAIMDFDVHHGNGTQEILEDERRVLYISTHQSPLYPGTGWQESNKGSVLNLPLPPGTESKTYRRVFTDSVLPALDTFNPQLLLVSAGFDGHKKDPLSDMQLAEEDYRWIGQQLNECARQHSQNRMISFLEGGYHHQALAASVTAYLNASCV